MIDFANLLNQAFADAIRAAAQAAVDDRIAQLKELSSPEAPADIKEYIENRIDEAIATHENKWDHDDFVENYKLEKEVSDAVVQAVRDLEFETRVVS